nr:hypothetical protein [Stenoxybacter acetivorans]
MIAFIGNPINPRTIMLAGMGVNRLKQTPPQTLPPLRFSNI